MGWGRSERLQGWIPRRRARKYLMNVRLTYFRILQGMPQGKWHESSNDSLSLNKLFLVLEEVVIIESHYLFWVSKIAIYVFLNQTENRKYAACKMDINSKMGKNSKYLEEIMLKKTQGWISVWNIKEKKKKKVEFCFIINKLIHTKKKKMLSDQSSSERVCQREESSMNYPLMYLSYREKLHSLVQMQASVLLPIWCKWLGP